MLKESANRFEGVGAGDETMTGLGSGGVGRTPY